MEEIENEELVKKIVAEKDDYEKSSAGRRKKWVDCWGAYNSVLDTTKNPFLANLFIPKTHEAVELLAAFLAGSNQSVTAEAEGIGDTPKAILVKKWLEYQWRKVLEAQGKIKSWIKQGILFGNGIMKVGWDAEKKEPFMEVINLTDVYFNYWYRDIQSSPSVIHIIRKLKDEVREDEKYNEDRKNVISKNEMDEVAEERSFLTYDNSIFTEASEDETVLMERWTLDEVITLAPTSFGWKILRQIDNPYKDSDSRSFIPFVKFRLKNNPLANRAYDIGAIEPTLKIQKAFNDMLNEIFDNVSLINNKMWIKRRGANINPMDLVRRPGGVITVEKDINGDIKAEEVSDIKASALEVLKILDSEFQQASMVVNILKGIPGAEFATEAALGQQNVLTLLDPVDQNIKEALSRLGQMILEINLANYKVIPSLKVFENDKEETWIKAKIENIKAKYDIRVEADRTALISSAVKQKQLIDFVSLVLKDAALLQKYPDLTEKIYRKWLKNAGEGDIDYFFEQTEQPAQGEQPIQEEYGAEQMPSEESTGIRMPATREGLTDGSLQRSAISAMLNK